MIRYDNLWKTMEKKGITKYALHKKHHISKSLIHRLQNNEGINMNTINTHHREGILLEPAAMDETKKQG